MVLSVLLVLSLGLLVFGVMRVFDRYIAESSVRNNRIGAVAEFRMEISNMLPGDSDTKNYEIELKHEEDVYLYFQVNIEKTTNNLENVLYIKVENKDNSTVVCEGNLANVAEKKFKEEFTLTNSNKNEKLNYKITVAMDTSAGNEYQNSSLSLSFVWSLRKINAEETK